LIKYIIWQKKIENSLKNFISDNNFNRIFNFLEPEKDLRTLFALHSITQLLGFTSNILNLSEAVPFLIGEIEQWSKFNRGESISRIKPPSFYSGIYLIKVCNIGIKISICEYNLRNILNILKTKESPIFTHTFLTYYAIEAVKLLDLNIGKDFYENISKKTGIENTSIGNLSSFNTDKLAMIVLLFKTLGYSIELNSEILKEKAIINSDLVKSGQSSKGYSIETLWGAFSLLIESNTFNMLDLEIILNSLIDKLNELAERIEIDKPEILCKILLGIRIFEKIDSHYDPIVALKLEKYIFS
ncbi:MAG: hypothetical protein ACTSWY_04880, partial [Promethearchaeota archaeon]